MKKLERKKTQAGILLTAVVLSIVNLALDLSQARGQSGWGIVVIFTLALLGQVWDIRKTLKQAREEEEVQENPAALRDQDYFARSAVGVTAGADWLLHKINPEYDPEAERNARRANSDKLDQLDELKQAGLIDEREYQTRKEKILAGDK